MVNKIVDKQRLIILDLVVKIISNKFKNRHKMQILIKNNNNRNLLNHQQQQYLIY